MPLSYKTFYLCGVLIDSGPHSPSITSVTGAVASELKWPGREVLQSLLSSVNARNEWSYNSIPSISLTDSKREDFIYVKFRYSIRH
jgi:hypothetical protein